MVPSAEICYYHSPDVGEREFVVKFGVSEGANGVMGMKDRHGDEFVLANWLAAIRDIIRQQDLSIMIRCRGKVGLIEWNRIEGKKQERNNKEMGR